MAKPYDAIFKQIIDDHAPAWMALLAPQFGLPSGPLEAIDPDLSTVQPTADKVFRLPNDAGLLHLEVQSSHELDLPNRIFLYNALLHDRYGGPVHSIVLLLRRAANSPSLNGVLTRQRADGGEYLRFAYDLVRVWELHADEMLAGAIGTAPLALLTDDAESRLPEVVRRLAARIETEIPEVGVQDRTLAGCYLMMGLRYNDSVIRPLFHGVQHMRESSTYQAILQEGIAVGRTEGIVRGRTEGRTEGILTGRTEGIVVGRTEGRIDGLRRSLIMLLEQKFGSIPRDLDARIQELADPNQLEAAIRQVLTIHATEELKL